MKDEINILIEAAEGTGKSMLATAIAGRLTEYRSLEINVRDFYSVDMLRTKIARTIDKPDFLIFENIDTPEILANVVEALKEYRASVQKTVGAVMVCGPAAIVLSHRTPLVINNVLDADRLDDLRKSVGDDLPFGKMLIKEEGPYLNVPRIEDVTEEQLSALNKAFNVGPFFEPDGAPLHIGADESVKTYYDGYPEANAITKQEPYNDENDSN